MTCDMCKEVWPLEENYFYCPCGHIQKTEYTDTAAVLEVGDQVVDTDGETVYVRRRTGTVEVARCRQYVNDAY